MKYLALSEFANLPRMRAIQNPYSLLNRKFEVGNAEVAHREQLGLLAYSPMAFGILSGKYRGGKLPKIAAFNSFPKWHDTTVRSLFKRRTLCFHC